MLVVGVLVVGGLPVGAVGGGAAAARDEPQQHERRDGETDPGEACGQLPSRRLELQLLYEPIAEPQVGYTWQISRAVVIGFHFGLLSALFQDTKTWSQLRPATRANRQL